MTSGWFWDSGVVAVAFRGDDHWSNDGVLGWRTWADREPEPVFDFEREMFALVDEGVR